MSRKAGKWPWKSTPKNRARAVVKMALRRGKIQRKPCEICDLVSPVQAHHADYSKPYAIRWLCTPHHRMVDQGKLSLLPLRSPVSAL